MPDPNTSRSSAPKGALSVFWGQLLGGSTIRADRAGATGGVLGACCCRWQTPDISCLPSLSWEVREVRGWVSRSASRYPPPLKGEGGGQKGSAVPAAQIAAWTSLPTVANRLASTGSSLPRQQPGREGRRERPSEGRKPGRVAHPRQLAPKTPERASPGLLRATAGVRGDPAEGTRGREPGQARWTLDFDLEPSNTLALSVGREVRELWQKNAPPPPAQGWGMSRVTRQLAPAGQRPLGWRSAGRRPTDGCSVGSC